MDTAKLTTAACISYAANASLGLGVATKVVDTSGVRWLHHALYISTLSLTGLVVWTGISPLVLSARSAVARKPRGIIAGREAGASLPPVRAQGAGNRRKNKGALASWILLPALVPLGALSTVDARSPLHPLVALTAAPFYLTAGVVAAVAGSKKRKEKARAARSASARTSAARKRR